jgi:hypothetical protein
VSLPPPPDDPVGGAADRARRRPAVLAPTPGPVRRLPLVAALLLFVVGALVVERASGDEGVPAAGAPATLAGVAAVAGPHDPGSTWYCAAGTARGPQPPSAEARPATLADLMAEHTVVLTNVAEQPGRARVTVYSGDTLTKPQARDVEVPARDRVEVALADIVRSTYASAVVEVQGGTVAVSHRLHGPTLTATTPCAGQAANAWYFAAGTTEKSTRQLLTLFNPFPQQAVVDVSFQADEGTRQSSRRPRKLEGLVVPAERSVTIDVTEEVPARRQVSTRVEAREPTARLVAERLLVNPGAMFELPLLAASVGSPVPRSVWVFADGRPRRPGLETTYVLFNPGTDPVEVELRVRPDGVAGPVEPFRATVRPGQYQEINLDDRVGASAGYWAAAVARGGGTFVVERVVRAIPANRPADPGGTAVPPSVLDLGGVTFSSGSPVLANGWVVPAATLPPGGAGLIVVTNLGTATVTLTVSATGAGGSQPVPAYTNVTLDAGARTTLDLTDPTLPAAGGRRSVLVTADGPVAVSSASAGANPAVVMDALGVPLRDHAVTAPVEVTNLAVPLAPADPTAPSGTAGPPGTR